MPRRPALFIFSLVAVLAPPALGRAEDPAPAAPSWAVHAAAGEIFTFASNHTFAGINGTRNLGSGVRVGLQLQSSIDGCTTWDCDPQLIETLAAGELHTDQESVVDPWIGLQMGPVMARDWNGGAASVGLSAQAAVGFDIRPVLDQRTRPVFGLSLTGGGWVMDGGFTAILPGVWLRGGVEF
jgi:hypothetical protein